MLGISDCNINNHMGFFLILETEWRQTFSYRQLQGCRCVGTCPGSPHPHPTSWQNGSWAGKPKVQNTCCDIFYMLHKDMDAVGSIIAPKRLRFMLDCGFFQAESWVLWQCRCHDPSRAGRKSSRTVVSRFYWKIPEPKFSGLDKNQD